jgi:hypothetical protein
MSDVEIPVDQLPPSVVQQMDEGLVQEASPEPQLPPPAQAQPTVPVDQGNAGPPPTPPLVTESAFLVYLDQQGRWVADGNVSRQITKAREPNFVDFHNACTTIIKDVVVMETANRVVMTQQQAMAQMAEQMQTREIARKIGGPVGAGLSGGGLHIPG